jgi:hypothetical protein
VILQLLLFAALGGTVLAAGIQIAMVRDRRTDHLLGGLVMAAAMMDTTLFQQFSTVAWMAVLLVVAMVGAAARSPRRRLSGGGQGLCATVSSALGLIAMAHMLPLMNGAVGVAASEGHSHAGSPIVLIMFVVLLSASHAIVSIVAAVRSAGRVRTLESLLMGAATGSMAIACLIAQATV